MPPGGTDFSEEPITIGYAIEQKTTAIIAYIYGTFLIV
jgi:hypothetical protein